MNHRESLIFKQLVQQNSGYMTYDALSALLNLSVSTLRQSLNNIDVILKEKTLNPIIRKPRYGVRLDSRDENLHQTMLKELEETVQAIDFSLTNNRQVYILFVILCGINKVTLESISEEMDVSRRTIQNDIKALKKEMQLLNCSIKYDHDSYVIHGGPVTIRTLIVNKIRENVTTPDEYEIISYFENLYSTVFKDRPKISEKIANLYSYLQTILPVNYTPTSYLYIVVYVGLLGSYSKRINGEHFPDSEETRLEESTLFDLAKSIITKAQEILKQDINYYETYYLTVMLHSLPVTDFSDFDTVYPLELELLVNQLILKVSELMSFKFYEDVELPKLMINHTIPAIQRMKFDSQIKNPLTSMIEQKYPELNQAIHASIEILETYVGLEMVNDECALYTLYFASSMEKLMMHKKPKDVIVVCNSGNAVSRLLQYKLNNAFDITIRDFVSGIQLKEAVREKKPDLIISVLNHEETVIDDVPILTISPLLTNTDMQNLKNHLSMIEPEEKENQAYSECELLKYLTPEMFSTDVEVQDHEALILYSGKLLEQGKCANASYGREMIEVTKRFGSLAHFLIAPNIILPHAGISENVYATGFSFTKLKNPIYVNENSISIAIAMCTTDKKSHEKAVLELGELFNDAQFLKKILTVKNYREFSKLVLLTLRKER